MLLSKRRLNDLTSFVTRYGNPKYTGADNQAFAVYFRDNTSKQLLGAVMNTLNVKATGRFITDDVYRMV